MTSFKRIYNRADHGDKTRVANSRGCSLEYISKLTRIGGESCPAEGYIKWLADWVEVNSSVADDIHEHASELYREIRNGQGEASFEAAAVVTELAQRTTDAIVALLDGKVTPDDEEALLRLASAVNGALSRIRSTQATGTIEVLTGGRRK